MILTVVLISLETFLRACGPSFRAEKEQNVRITDRIDENCFLTQIIDHLSPLHRKYYCSENALSLRLIDHEPPVLTIYINFRPFLAEFQGPQVYGTEYWT